jgi:DNA-binding NtrC family response regulator
MIATVLEAAGATVETADSALVAERYVSDHKVDAVLLDWNLDDVSGPALLERMEKARPGTQQRVTVMTGDLIARGETHEAERRGLLLLRKPFRPRALIEAVERALKSQA